MTKFRRELRWLAPWLLTLLLTLITIGLSLLGTFTLWFAIFLSLLFAVFPSYEVVRHFGYIKKSLFFFTGTLGFIYHLPLVFAYLITKESLFLGVWVSLTLLWVPTRWIRALLTETPFPRRVPKHHSSKVLVWWYVGDAAYWFTLILTLVSFLGNIKSPTSFYILTVLMGGYVFYRYIIPDIIGIIDPSARNNFVDALIAKTNSA